MDIIKIKNLNKSFKNKVVYEGLNFHVKSNNQVITIWGKSGSGKSTLLNMLLGYDQKYDGEIEVFGKNIKKMSKKDYIDYLSNDIGVVYQDLKLYNNLTVLENLDFVADEGENLKYLKLFNILDLKNKKISDLSGGQKQRVAIIRALVKNSKLLILDEPTAMIDKENFNELMKILNVLKKKITIVIFTHDQKMIEYSDSIYNVENKKISVEKEIEYSKLIDNECRVLSEFKGISLLKGTLKLIKEQKKNYFTKIILMLMVVNICLIMASAGISSLKHSIDNYYGGLSDNVIVLDINSPKETYEFDNVNYLTPDDKISWSESDKEKVEQVEGVKAVYFATPKITDLTDNSSNYLEKVVNSADYPEAVSTKPSHFTGKSFTIRFKSLPEPNNVIPYYKSQFLLDVEMLSGDYPNTGTNEILIPDMIADQLILNGNSDTYEGLIGQLLSLDVVENSNQDNEKNITQDYYISGVYDTDYENFLSSEYYIYTSWTSRLLTDEELLDLYNQAPEEEVNGYYSPLYKNFSSYKEGYGVGEDQMIILLDDGYTSKDIYDEIDKLYPNINQISRYSYETNEVFQSSKKVIIGNYIILEILFIIISSLVLLVVQRGYYIDRRKDFSILLSLGYSKTKLLTMLLLESIIDAVIVCILTFPLSQLIGLIPFSIFYNYAQGIFLPVVILMLIILSLFSNILNVIVVTIKIKYENLTKFLK